MFEGACYTNCPDGYTEESVSEICILCDSTCATCSGTLATECLSCKGALFLKNS